MPAFPRIDPVGVFNFSVVLLDSAIVDQTLFSTAKNLKVAGFSECSGLDASVEVFEYREGGVNDFVHKFPTRASHANVTLRRGVIPLDHDLWQWHRDFVEGKGSRRDGLIFLLNESHLPAKVWKFTRGLPLKWTGPALNAAQGSVAIEALEISHEGLTFNL